LSRLLLVRHGNTELNSAQIFVGHTDVELSATGHWQVEKLRDRLSTEKIDVIYSSDLRRALGTAETIASPHRLEVIACPELREFDYGELDGLTFAEICRLHPEVAELCACWSLRLKFPGGESVDQLRQRVSGFLDRLQQHSPEQTVLVVTHGGLLRLMVCALLGIDLRHWGQINIDLASLSIVDTYPEAAVIGLLNDTSHLR